MYVGGGVFMFVFSEFVEKRTYNISLDFDWVCQVVSQGCGRISDTKRVIWGDSQIQELGQS